ncbi:hypothetical protein J4434_03715 [Candidatus Woesearchaeota archaeon]|nr:hypothetical protein [Candidatus Woesearchaeota archaeon]
MVHHTKNESLSMADGLLGGLEDIEGPRDAQARLKSVLERLIEVEIDVLERSIPLSGSRPTYNDYWLIYNNTIERTKDIDFNNNDIAKLIFSVNDKGYGDNFSRSLGMFMGVLVHILTERNQKQGKRTRLYFNGKGITFNYLFMYTSFFDELVVENFNGRDICAWTSIYMYLPSSYSTRVFCRNISGGGTLDFAGSHGGVDQMIAVNIKDSSLKHIGSNGNIKQLIAVGVVGGANLCSLSNQGYIHDAILIDINGYVPFDNYNKKITVFNRIIGDITEDIVKHIDANEFICRETATKEQRRIIELARSLSGKPYQEVLKIADELYALRPKVPEGGFGRK